MFVRRFALAVALVVAACTQPPSSGTGPGPAAMAVPASLNEAPRERLGPQPALGHEPDHVLGVAVLRPADDPDRVVDVVLLVRRVVAARAVRDRADDRGDRGHRGR